jgi:acetate---CoA ligase (ADP-forming)
MTDSGLSSAQPSEKSAGNRMRRSLWSALTAPQSVVIVGASRDESKLGRRALRHTLLAGYSGTIYPVNYAAQVGDVAEGLALFTSAAELGGPIDLAYVALPADSVAAAAAECSRVGARAVIVPGSGFAEFDDAGSEAEAELKAIAVRGNIRLLGPNCFGIYRQSSGLNLTPFTDIPGGNVSLISQSGNMASALFVLATEAGIGFSTAIGVGNQADISFGELLTFMAADPETRAIALYIEGIPTGRVGSFVRGLRACRLAGKPVIVMKAGRSPAGALAAFSHTRAVATDDRIWQLALTSHGATLASSTEHCVDLLAASLRVRSTSGRAMILSDGGGDTVNAVDALHAADVPLARLEDGTIKKLEQLLPKHAPRYEGGNPATLDTRGGLEDDPVLLARCLDLVQRDPGVDVVIVTGILGAYRDHRQEELDCARQIVTAHQLASNILVHSAYANTGEAPITVLKAGGVPVFSTIQRLTQALIPRVAIDTKVGRETNPGNLPAAPTSLLPANPGSIGLKEAATILTDSGIELPPMHIVEDLLDLERALKKFVFPACLKLATSSIGHKSDVHGVLLNLPDVTSVLDAASELWRAHPGTSLLLMPMLPRGFELLTGFSTDPGFGPVVVVGRGGLWAEAEADTALLFAPTDESAVLEALRDLRCWPMLAGTRGQPALDVQSLCGLVVTLSHLATRLPGVALDLNPTILYEHGHAIADLRMVRSN